MQWKTKYENKNDVSHLKGDQTRDIETAMGTSKPARQPGYS